MSVAKVCYFLNLPRIRVNKEVTLSRSSAYFRPYTKSARMPNLAADLSGISTFFWPFLTYAAEQSASWQHYVQCQLSVLKGPKHEIF